MTSIDLRETPLMQFLQRKNAVYYGKVLEVREVVGAWLSYIPQTFPHYTRHTIDHSEEIVSQVSSLLFHDGDVDRPVLPKISGAEAYILIAAAFLHDSGMVCADSEKARILASGEWHEWTTRGGGVTRWRAIAEFREGPDPSDPALRNLLADIQARHMVAEFVRKRHHLRAGDLIAGHQAELGRFAFDDGEMQRTIADVCVSHGLRSHELADATRFPDRRDIRNEKVNVRLLSILLRLGDLLDLRADRACPLLLNAACPLPAESLAHWTQYQRFVDRNVSPDVIRLSAQCETQDEHRFLHDWCSWISDEVRDAAFAMVGAQRHADWKPPRAVMDNLAATIVITPSPTATYFPSKWHLELDQEAVLSRLIHDAYDVPHAFIRELIQNAADATRCQLYADLKAEGVPLPRYPTQLDAAIRGRYRITVSSEWTERRNPLSGEIERKQIVRVSDCGIGMDRSVIERYLLQVGRTFYDSDEFRREFGFYPTSRFGIGFLSVFAAGECIDVDTYKPSTAAEAVHLTLKAPRSCLLTETGNRKTHGTTVEVLLSSAIDDDELVAFVKHWCKRVEFTVRVETATRGVLDITHEEPADFVRSSRAPDGPVFGVRAISIGRDGIDAELYVPTITTAAGEERWGSFNEAKAEASYLRAIAPELPEQLLCLHGINTEPPGRLRSKSTLNDLAIRADVRDPNVKIDLSRINARANDLFEVLLYPRINEILLEHIAACPFANGENGWKYRLTLASWYVNDQFWVTVPEMMPVFVNGKIVPSRVNDLHCTEIRLLTTTYEADRSQLWRKAGAALDAATSGSSGGRRVLIREGDPLGIQGLGYYRLCGEICRERVVRRCEVAQDGWVMVDLATAEEDVASNHGMIVAPIVPAKPYIAIFRVGVRQGVIDPEGVLGAWWARCVASAANKCIEVKAWRLWADAFQTAMCEGPKSLARTMCAWNETSIVSDDLRLDDNSIAYIERGEW